MKESSIQKPLVEAIRKMNPRLPFWHTPNGFNLSAGYNRWGQINHLKAMGMLPGVSDLLFYWNGQLSALELKKPKKDRTDNQEEFQAMIATHGANVAVCHSMEEGMDIISDWGLFDRKLRGAA